MVLAKRGSRLTVTTPRFSAPEPKSSIQFSGDWTLYVPYLCLAPALTAAPSVPVQNKLPDTSIEHSPPKDGPRTSRARSLALVKSLLVRDNVGWSGSELVLDAIIALSSSGIGNFHFPSRLSAVKVGKSGKEVYASE